MNASDRTLLKLLRLALGTDDGTPLQDITKDEWRQLIDHSYSQGLPSIVFDGLHEALKVNGDLNPALDDPEMEEDKYGWMGGVFQDEEDNRKFSKKLAELCSIFAGNGLTPVLLKGQGLGLNYPQPLHRPVGDVDLFILEGAYKADLLVRKSLQIDVTKSKLGHHSHFNYRGLSVENHYELSNTYFGGSRSKRLENNLRELITEDLTKEKESDSYYLPGPDFNAVFQIWHLGTHFCGERISLRQLCDFMMFLKNNHSRVDWPRVRKIWEDAGTLQFVDAVGNAMMKYLNMPAEWLPVVECDEMLGDRLMNDVLDWTSRESSAFSRICHYFAARWKYKITSGRNWVMPMLSSAWMHAVHSDDLIEKTVK